MALPPAALPIATSNIVQMAFAVLSLDPPSSLADGAAPVQDAARFFAEAADSVIEGADWSFASVSVDLVPALRPDLAADPRLPWLYVLPPEALVIRRVGHGPVNLRRDLDVLRADDPGPLHVRYTARIADESRLPAAVRQLMALRLAQLMGGRWLTVPEKLAQIDRRAEAALIEARRQDARQASSAVWGEPDARDWARMAVR